MKLGAEMNYRALKKKQFDAKKDKRIVLSPEESDWIRRVEAIRGYEVALHLPAGSRYILVADDAEIILRRIDPIA